MPTHVDYPHTPGYLPDCDACEARCHCTFDSAECVYEGEHTLTETRRLPVVVVTDGWREAIGDAFATVRAIVGDDDLTGPEPYGRVGDRFEYRVYGHAVTPATPQDPATHVCVYVPLVDASREPGWQVPAAPDDDTVRAAHTRPESVVIVATNDSAPFELTYRTGWVSLDDATSVLAQYDPADRWNGFIGTPWLDAWSVVTVLEATAAAYLGDEWSNEPDAGYAWEWSDDDATLILRDLSADTVERVEPDADGLYALGAHGWVWSPVDDARTYVVGLPVIVTVHDDGRVEYVVDTAETGEAIREDENGDDATRERDAAAADADHAARQTGGVR